MVVAAEKAKKSGKKSKGLKAMAKEAGVDEKVAFSEVKAPCFKEVKVDEKAKKVKTKAVSLDKIDAQVDKVKDGISRYKASTNKKNTTFLKNNLEKLIKEAQALLDIIE